jgi:hypothetical protein
VAAVLGALTIRLSEVDLWMFPDMTKFFNKANIVFVGIDRKSGCISTQHLYVFFHSLFGPSIHIPSAT